LSGIVWGQTPPVSLEVLAGIADLDLIARIIVEGLASGLHRSPFHGYSAEFSQYRHYRPGDDVKYVDWKLVARTDRVYTKQFRETTNMAAALVLDASASMAFGDPVAEFRYAVMLAAALARLVSRQGVSCRFCCTRSEAPGRLGRAPASGSACSAATRSREREQSRSGTLSAICGRSGTPGRIVAPCRSC
jgi:uncharacterized protein (DUF58 family)